MYKHFGKNSLHVYIRKKHYPSMLEKIHLARNRNAFYSMSNISEKRLSIKLLSFEIQKCILFSVKNLQTFQKKRLSTKLLHCQKKPSAYVHQKSITLLSKVLLCILVFTIYIYDEQESLNSSKTRIQILRTKFFYKIIIVGIRNKFKNKFSKKQIIIVSIFKKITMS